jgi:hypothetical protein
MSKSRYRSKLLIEVEEKPQHIIEAKEENGKNNLTIEQEIDCPRCHDTMALGSDFDRLGYVCPPSISG